jgi:phosphoglycolate phosphatase-like HAD superfamily hydrolase
LAEKWRLDVRTDMIMVGDHATDIEVGQRAGCKTVFLAGTIGDKRNLTPDFIIESLADLPGLLTRF